MLSDIKYSTDTEADCIIQHLTAYDSCLMQVECCWLNIYHFRKSWLAELDCITGQRMECQDFRFNVMIIMTLRKVLIIYYFIVK